MPKAQTEATEPGGTETGPTEIGPTGTGAGRREAKSSPRRLAVRKTYKLYLGGAFPRSESGRSYVVSTPEGHPWRTPRWRPEKTSATLSSPPARRSRAGRRPPLTTAVKSCTGRPRCWRAVTLNSQKRWRRGSG